MILTRIQDFNRAMNVKPINPNNPINRIFYPGLRQTGNAGEPVQPQQPQQIPLAINAANNYSLASSTVVPAANPYLNQDCCECSHCCQCCLIKPASYKNGLYRIDHQMYSVAFLLFAAFTIYPESILYSLHQSYQGLYLPSVGLALIFSASFFIFCKKDNFIQDNCNFLRGSMFIFGGLFYILGVDKCYF